MRLPSSREPTRRHTLASPSRTAAFQLTSYLKILRAGALASRVPRPELRNHGEGWMRAVERLRNGGVPRNPVFLNARNPLYIPEGGLLSGFAMRSDPIFSVCSSYEHTRR